MARAMSAGAVNGPTCVSLTKPIRSPASPAWAAGTVSDDPLESWAERVDVAGTVHLGGRRVGDGGGRTAQH